MEKMRKPRKLPEQIADKLREMIIQEEMKTGSKLPAEAELMARVLQENGVPREAIGMMSKGYELELATKAMLYDRGLDARRAAAAKVAEAPKVQTPHGAASADGDGARLKAARAALNKNPNSTEALAALFAAM